MVLVRPENHQISNGSDPQQTGVNIKTPKRVLQFCDGVLEEYSSDEEEIVCKDVVDPSTLNWSSWFLYKAVAVGSGTLSVIDTLGAFFASAFGITTPRYYFELEEYKNREQQAAKAKEEEKGWSQPSAQVPLNQDISEQPKPVFV